MASNMPTLYQNVCGGLSSETARRAFLWCADNRDSSRLKYPSEAYAREVENVEEWLEPMMRAARELHPGFDQARAEELMRFTLKRHANHRFGGNVSMWWE